MKRIFRIIIIILLLFAIAVLGVYFVGSHNIPVLEPKGMIGIKEKQLIITAALLMLIVVIPVLVLAIVFAYRYDKKNKGIHTPDWEHNNIAECCWWGVPVIIIAILAVITWKTSHELNPFNPIENGKTPIEIQVVALDWKWLFIYPDQGIATVNYVQFPEKTPVRFVLTADAPMNSFWIPQLGGMMAAMPATAKSLHLIANETGEFQGRSSQISGKGFSGMLFTAVSSTEYDFQKWVSSVKQNGRVLNWSSYQSLVKPTEYHPTEYYGDIQGNLFHDILMQYTPQGSKR